MLEHKKYTPLLAAQFLELVSRGHRTTTAAAAAGLSISVIHLWRTTRPGFDAAYEIARINSAKLPALPTGDCLLQWEKLFSAPAPSPPVPDVC